MIAFLWYALSYGQVSFWGTTVIIYVLLAITSLGNFIQLFFNDVCYLWRSLNITHFGEKGVECVFLGKMHSGTTVVR